MFIVADLVSLRNGSVTKFIQSSKVINFTVQLKLKCLLMKPTRDDVIKANAVYSQ